MKTLYKSILPPQTIGIIGGGQLGRMMALSARAMGYSIAVLDPTPNSPCGQIADIEITASFDDLESIQKLAKVSDVITYEFENINYETLLWLEENAYLPQGSNVLKQTQHRVHEKRMIEEAGLDVAPYKQVVDKAQLKEAIEELGLPAVLKTCRFGYDGKGQVVIKSENDMDKATALLAHGECVLEKWIRFEKEISVIVTRGTNGETDVFPVAENIHKDNILHQTIVPARVPQHLKKQAIRAAIILAEHVGLIGTLAVEMFVLNEETIFINELAPRPHNSGHFSIDACETSQFEQHVRAICGLPLGKTTLWNSIVMVNLLGENIDAGIVFCEQNREGKLHLYGKEEKKEKRKMGHLNIVSDTVEIALQKANELTVEV